MNKFFAVVSFVTMVFAGFSYADYPSNQLVKALAEHESGDNATKIGDKKLINHAYGHLQIRQPCLDDVNRKFKTHYKASQCQGNRKLSEWVCREYINMYATTKAIGHKPTDDDKSGIWNGGPNGFKSRFTVKYSAAIKKLLGKLKSRVHGGP